MFIWDWLVIGNLRWGWWMCLKYFLCLFLFLILRMGGGFNLAFKTLTRQGFKIN